MILGGSVNKIEEVTRNRQNIKEIRLKNMAEEMVDNIILMRIISILIISK